MAESTSAECSKKLDQSAESKDECVVSMVDVLAEEKQYEEDAKAVLGGSDPNQCTFQQGYLQRQALYACATCIKQDKEPAGVCLACSLECHDGHDLYELYTKRNFRCDCGNRKFSDFKCKLSSERDDVNEKNMYNQNFKGTYCVCKRPYPDPEDDVEDEMIQCIGCEDWFHGRHTGQENVPDDYDEFICGSCCLASDFLFLYATQYPKQNVSERKKVEMSGDNADVDIESRPEAKAASTTSESGEGKDLKKLSAENTSADKTDTSKESESASVSNRVENKPSTTADAGTAENKSAATADASTAENKSAATADVGTAENKPSTTAEAGATQKKPSATADVGTCHLLQLRANTIDVSKSGGRFWPEGWRRQLCKCENCMKLYEEKQVSFLCDESDTIVEYEKRGMSSNMDAYQQGIAALQNIDRTQQVEVLTEYASMKDQLTEYLKKFAENKKVVKEEDIKEFFEGLKANKRQRTGMQYFCR